MCPTGKVDFWIFRILNVKQLSLLWQKYFKIKLVKTFFHYFHFPEKGMVKKL
jgi:hypothetical protein